MPVGMSMHFHQTLRSHGQRLADRLFLPVTLEMDFPYVYIVEGI
jgi:hypothetical protein